MLCECFITSESTNTHYVYGSNPRSKLEGKISYQCSKYFFSSKFIVRSLAVRLNAKSLQRKEIRIDVWLHVHLETILLEQIKKNWAYNLNFYLDANDLHCILFVSSIHIELFFETSSAFCMQLLFRLIQS